jgi:hypothetical protein
MGSTTMGLAYEVINRQRFTWGAALIVAVVLIFYEGAPVVPVVVGCLLVAAIAVLRSWLRERKKL